MTQNHFREEVSEFKGSTSAKLEILFVEIKSMRKDFNDMKKDVNDLKSWKSWVMGLGATAGLMAGFLKDLFFKSWGR